MPIARRSPTRRPRWLARQPLPARCALTLAGYVGAYGVLDVLLTALRVPPSGHTLAGALEQLALSTPAAALGGYFFGRLWPAFAETGRVGMAVCGMLAGAAGAGAVGLLLGLAAAPARGLAHAPLIAAILGALGAGAGALLGLMARVPAVPDPPPSHPGV